MSRILITGGSGFLGHNIARALARAHEVWAGYLRVEPEADGAKPVRLDVSDSRAVSGALSGIKPDLVVHCAAMSNPDDCERDPARAHAVNAQGAANVAESCKALGCRCVHVSTDLVFDGRKGFYSEEDEVHGISVYSDSKIEAERRVLSILGRAAVLRVAVLYGMGPSRYPGFFGTVLRNWRAGKPVTFYSDQFRTPTYAPQVAEAAVRLLAAPEVTGILHLGGADRLSRLEFGRMLARLLDVPDGLVLSGSMRDSSTAARRGADCSLVSGRIERLLGIRPMGCEAGLAAVVREMAE